MKKVSYTPYKLPALFLGLNKGQIMDACEDNCFCELEKSGSKDLSCGWVDRTNSVDREHFVTRNVGVFMVFGVQLSEWRFTKTEIKPALDELKCSWRFSEETPEKGL